MMARLQRSRRSRATAAKSIGDLEGRVTGNLDAIAHQREPLLADPTTTFIALVLAEMEIRATSELMRRGYWPVI
jgi:hypothetical protein